MFEKINNRDFFQNIGVTLGCFAIGSVLGDLIGHAVLGAFLLPLIYWCARLFTNWFEPILVKKSHYIVSYSWWEEYSPVVVFGPAVEDWEKFCDSLLPQAIDLALKNQAEKKFPTWLGWNDIADSMVETLKEYGYKKIDLPEKTYNGTTIIKFDTDLKDFDPLLFNPIIQHNEAIEKKLYHKEELDGNV